MKYMWIGPTLLFMAPSGKGASCCCCSHSQWTWTCCGQFPILQPLPIGAEKCRDCPPTYLARLHSLSPCPELPVCHAPRAGVVKSKGSSTGTRQTQREQSRAKLPLTHLSSLPSFPGPPMASQVGVWAALVLLHLEEEGERMGARDSPPPSAPLGHGGGRADVSPKFFKTGVWHHQQTPTDPTIHPKFGAACGSNISIFIPKHQDVPNLRNILTMHSNPLICQSCFSYVVFQYFQHSQTKRICCKPRLNVRSSRICCQSHFINSKFCQLRAHKMSFKYW